MLCTEFITRLECTNGMIFYFDTIDGLQYKDKSVRWNLWPRLPYWNQVPLRLGKLLEVVLVFFV